MGSFHGYVSLPEGKPSDDDDDDDDDGGGVVVKMNSSDQSGILSLISSYLWAIPLYPATDSFFAVFSDVRMCIRSNPLLDIGHRVHLKMVCVSLIKHIDGPAASLWSLKYTVYWGFHLICSSRINPHYQIQPNHSTKNYDYFQTKPDSLGYLGSIATRTKRKLLPKLLAKVPGTELDHHGRITWEMGPRFRRPIRRFFSWRL